MEYTRYDELKRARRHGTGSGDSDRDLISASSSISNVNKLLDPHFQAVRCGQIYMLVLIIAAVTLLLVAVAYPAGAPWTYYDGVLVKRLNATRNATSIVEGDFGLLTYRICLRNPSGFIPILTANSDEGAGGGSNDGNGAGDRAGDAEGADGAAAPSASRGAWWSSVAREALRLLTVGPAGSSGSRKASSHQQQNPRERRDGRALVLETPRRNAAQHTQRRRESTAVSLTSSISPSSALPRSPSAVELASESAADADADAEGDAGGGVGGLGSGGCKMVGYSDEDVNKSVITAKLRSSALSSLIAVSIAMFCAAITAALVGKRLCFLGPKPRLVLLLLCWSIVCIVVGQLSWYAFGYVDIQDLMSGGQYENGSVLAGNVSLIAVGTLLTVSAEILLLVAVVFEYAVEDKVAAIIGPAAALAHAQAQAFAAQKD